MGKVPAQTPRISNKKAAHRFEILEQVEAGIALTGSEVKSLRQGSASLDEAYAVIREERPYLIGCNISPYSCAGYAQHQPTRERPLLLHRREIKKLLGKVTLKGLTLVPLGLYFNDRGLVKVRLALCKGKQSQDKRGDLKKREHERDMARAMKSRRR